MLLTLLNWSSSGAPPQPVYSVGNGIMCLETTVFADELAASVLIGQLASSLPAELATTLHQSLLSGTFEC